jgi:hypothetical protein
MVHEHEVPVPQTHRHIQNPEIARALEKIRRFHAVVKANGGTTVDLVQMAAGNAETAAVGAHTCHMMPSAWRTVLAWATPSLL